MKIRKMVGMPDLAVDPTPWMLPNGGDPTAGGTNGGAGTPAAPAAPPAPAAPAPTTPVAGAPASGPNGFPEGVQLEQMSSEQVTNYWKHWAKTNRTALEQRDAELATLRPKAEQYDALEAASRTDQERAVQAARTEGVTVGRTEAEQAAVAKYGTALVQARFESVLAGRKTAEEVATIVSGLNVAAFLGTDGLPDTEKVAAYATTVAPAAQQQKPPGDLGGGRTPAPVAGGLQAGADLYESTRKKPRTV